MSKPVVDAFLTNFETHIRKFGLKSFHLSLHGGEPLLFPKERFRELCLSVKKIGEKLGCKIEISVNSNGTLIDDEWCQIFKDCVDYIGVSIDGPKTVHDLVRVDLKGSGSFDRVLRGVRCLQNAGITFGILCVVNSASRPQELVSLFVDELCVKSFDILIPDATYDNPPSFSVADFYTELFDIYTTSLVPRGVRVRILREWTRTCLGFGSRTQSIGRGPIRTVMIKQNGRIEPLDTLHNLGDKYNPGNLTVFDNQINDITDDPLWREVYYASSTVPKECNTCVHRQSCGGGNVVERWSSRNGFSNKSVYCDDLLKIYDHVSEFISSTLANA
jgi:uncharacterized protein